MSTEILQAGHGAVPCQLSLGRTLAQLGLSVTDFELEPCVQFDLAHTQEQRERAAKLERTVDDLKRRFGNYCIQRASLLGDTGLSRFNPHDDHTIHPVGFLIGKEQAG